MSKRLIHLAPKLSLPAAKLATTVTAILGIRGSGKSNLAAVIAEGFLDAKIPVIILDRVGIWFSLRLAADGKKPSGYQIPVLGGVHGDIQLSPDAGAEVAEALASSHSSAVLDISRFTKTQRIKFATDFGEAFFEAKKRFPGPVSVMLEEAQKYIPQVIRFSGSGLERCLGAYEELAEQGRNYGAGLILISLRPEKLNKDVVNLSDNIVAMRTIGVHERKAIADWVQEKEADGRDQVKNELPSLPEGQGIVWSPGIFKLYGKFSFRLKSTYDAGKTPERVRAAVRVKPLDLDKLQTAMKKIVEEAKVNEPTTLKARIAELEKQLARKSAVVEQKIIEKVIRKVVEVPVITERQLKRIEKVAQRIYETANKADKGATAVLKESSALRADVTKLVVDAQAIVDSSKKGDQFATTSFPGKVLRKGPGKYKIEMAPTAVSAPTPTTVINQTGSFEIGPNGEYSASAKAILNVLAQRKKSTATEIAIISGYSKKSSGFLLAMARLKKEGLITGSSKSLEITELGIKFTGSGEPLPTGKDLYHHWLKRLTTTESNLLRTLYENGCHLTRVDLAAKAKYSMKSSGLNMAIAALIRLGIFENDHANGLKLSGQFL